MLMQHRFNPIDYGFEWTEDGWYKWDSKAAHKQARQARDAEARLRKGAGQNVKKWSEPNQLMRRGGIGSGKPDVEFIVTIYGFNTF
jgi:hypothetical protein